MSRPLTLNSLTLVIVKADRLVNATTHEENSENKIVQKIINKELQKN